MRIGWMCRMTARGLGYQTRDFATNMPDVAPLIVDNPADANLGYQNRPDWYPPGTPVVQLVDGRLEPASTVRSWLAECDVIGSAETLYDDRVYEWAAARGVATVVHSNPEFYRHHLRPHARKHPAPTMWMLPTPWLADRYPPGTPVVPVPPPTPPGRLAADPHDGPLRVLHVIGHRAAGDRNGTAGFLRSASYIDYPAEFTVTCQDADLPNLDAVFPRGSVTDIRLVGPTDDRWDLYRGHDVLVIPRRYGGLCVPALEAMAAGLAVALPNVSPNTMWPIVPISASLNGWHAAPGGRVPAVTPNPRHVGSVINKLAAHRDLLRQAQTAAADWAATNTWEALTPVYLEHLTEATTRARQ